MPKFFILIAAMGLIAAACGGGATSSDDGVPSVPTAIETTTTVADDDPAAPQAERAIEISMTEFTFGIDPLEVAAGETIEFVVTNAGVVAHEFRLSNAERIEEHIAAGHEGHTDDGDEPGADGDIVMTLEPGETSTIMVTFPDDTALFTELACLIPGHHEAGMSAEIAYIS